MKFTLTNKQRLSDTVALFTFRSKNGEPIEFSPGQYISLRFRRFGRPTPARCFSIVNTPNEEGVLQIACRIKGRFTTSLSQLPINNLVDIDGPYGEFMFDPAVDVHTVLIAGGIGITPFISMVRYAVKLKLSNQITLLYSVRNEHDIPFAEYLLQLEQANPNFRVVFVVTDDSITRFNDGHSVTGRISSELLTQAAENNFVSTSFFICGPRGFMDAVTAELQMQGVVDDQIFTEAFTQSHAVRNKNRLFTFGQYFTSTYGLAAAAFVIIVTGIMISDVAAHATKTAISQTNPASTTSTPTTTAASSSSISPTATTPTITTQTTQYAAPSYTPVYRQPISSVS